MSPTVFLYSCMLMSTTWFSCLQSRFTDTHVLTYTRHLAFILLLAWGVSSDSPGFSCPGFGAWSVWVPLVADQSSAAVVWTIRSSILPGPCVPLEFPCCKLVSALLLFMFVYFLVFSQLRHSGDVNIIVIFITSGDNSVMVLLCWNV